jgi:hypothetical protein
VHRCGRQCGCLREFVVIAIAVTYAKSHPSACYLRPGDISEPRAECFDVDRAHQGIHGYGIYGFG